MSQVDLVDNTEVELREESGEEYSFWKEKFKAFNKHKLARRAAIVLLVMYSIVIFAGFLSPYHPNTAFKKHFFHAPTKIHFTDEDGLSWPYVYATEKVGWGKYEENTSQKYPIKFFYRGDEYKLLNLIPTDLHFFGVEEPVHIFLMGTDNFGRDLFSRILFGGRVSMFIGFLGIIITTVFGLLIGGIAGYYGGWLDNILMRLAEVILSIPSFYLLLALAGILPIEMSSTFRFFLIIVILSFIRWAGMARVVRGMVMSIKNEDYVVAAKALGATDWRIIWKHVLPVTTTYIIINATLAIPGYILMESGLSFIGLGIQEPSASWGNMLSAAQSVTKIVSFPWLLIPGLMIFLVILCFNLFGDGIRDALDPKGTVE